MSIGQEFSCGISKEGKHWIGFRFLGGLLLVLGSAVGQPFCGVLGGLVVGSCV